MSIDYAEATLGRLRTDPDHRVTPNPNVATASTETAEAVC